jgi:hypothetical protein
MTKAALVAALVKAGKQTARLYIELLYLGIVVFPFIFCGGLIYVAALIADMIGGGLGLDLGIAGLILFAGVSFIFLIFFSVFACPHISSEIDKALDTLQLAKNKLGTTRLE